MSFLRNPEIKKDIISHFFISIIIVIIGFYISIKFGIAFIIVCLILNALHFLTTYKRYRKISLLSYEINTILYGKDNIDLDSFHEGELAILQSEISKMIVRIREQSATLSKDKQYLADSIADISHQIKTPLTSMQIIITLMQKAKINSDEQSFEKLKIELLQLIHKIEGLISSLLKISRLDTGTVIFAKQKVDIEELISRSTQPILIQMELKEISLIKDIQQSASYIGDISWSCEAILNIIKNCMEHTQAGGAITVTSIQNAIYTEIIIADNGDGINKKDLPYMFERFYKGENSSEQSYGIGLSLARMIITSQNGTIKAKNNADKGASFIIRFYKNYRIEG